MEIDSAELMDLGVNVHEWYQRLEKLSLKQLSKASIYESLAACMEELGELSRTLRVEEGAYGCRNKTIKEPSQVEAVDLILCAFEVFIARGGTLEGFLTIANSKLNKFEINQK